MQWKPPGSRRADLGDAADFLPVSAGKFPEKQEFPSLVVSETQSFGKPSSSEDSLDNAACPLAIVQLPLRGRDMPPIPSGRLDPVHRRARGNKLRLEAPPVAAGARVHCHNHPAHWKPLRQPTRCVTPSRWRAAASTSAANLSPGRSTATSLEPDTPSETSASAGTPPFPPQDTRSDHEGPQASAPPWKSDEVKSHTRVARAIASTPARNAPLRRDGLCSVFTVTAGGTSPRRYIWRISPTTAPWTFRVSKSTYLDSKSGFAGRSSHLPSAR